MKGLDMRKLLLIMAVLCLCTEAAFADDCPQIVNIAGRRTVSLDGQWKTIVDQYETGYYDYRRNPINERASFFADASFDADRTRLVEYEFDAARELRVPGDWNTQSADLYRYEGTVWYRTKFDAPDIEGRAFVYFGASNYETVVGINGHVLGTHLGGFTPFNYEVTGLLREGDNSLIAKVDNKRMLDAVPTVNSDWWNYGGITRSVYLVCVPETFIRDYCVQLKRGTTGTLEGWIQLDGSRAEQDVKVEIPEAGIVIPARTDASGRASFEFKAVKRKKSLLSLWSPESPKLYDVVISSETDSVSDRIGFRSVETRGTQILLNGEPVFCKGISIHEESLGTPGGRGCGEENAREILGLAKELGCNFVRLAHYPHDEAMVRVADELGIMVWDEIPVYWTIQFENPSTYANAERQLTDMISRDRNRASVIIWSVANETPQGPARLDFLTRLISKARELDSTRLVSSAMEKDYIDATHCTLKDDLMGVADLLSFNQYVGWYDGDSDKCDRVEWVFSVQKPVFISEWGGGALYGRHGDRTERFTEEYQAYLYEKNVRMLDRIPGLAGTTPWVLKDFRSPKRMLDGIQDDYNRKGVVSPLGEKKQAFFVLQRWYSSK